ncbi:hypothetical protein K504DRAFT_369936 [Pleomassaria siparia CBS 279.74]|uniref:Uncharacterized protein n=1 Tax=Pleomassaria siparia CBS 279.74 TaxID=1314801 RepID=A0A6G1KJH3_9PLEO|nr:hypothetical protein K504DRAFT_369936 [Pleomassaria siparia CBS 279.74]
MLAPRASSAFICIRCELRLARPRLSALAPPPRATFSTSARRHDAFDEQPQFRFPVLKPRGELISRPSKIGRLRKRKGKAPLRETTETLGGVKTLGDDAKILLLKEEGEAEPEETPVLLITPQKAVDIIASLDLENASVGQEEINKRLDGLRPEPDAPPDEPQYIPYVAFLKLRKCLVDGFTLQQLLQYYNTKHGWEKQVSMSVPAKESGISKKPLDRTQWHLGTTQLNRRLPKSHVVHSLKGKANNKSMLVDQILRTAWNIVVLEEMEAPGEIELTLKPWQVFLLQSGTPCIYNQIGRDRKARVEVYQEHNAIRITANKSTAEYAADDVQQLLSNTERAVLDLAPFRRLLIEDPTLEDSTTRGLSLTTLEAVGRLSRTYIQVVKNHLVMIRGFDKISVEEARRGLLRTLPYKLSPRSIDRRKVLAAQKECYLLPTPFKGFLDYRFRNAEYGRWSLPVHKAPDAASQLEHNVATSDKAVAKTDEQFSKRISRSIKAIVEETQLEKDASPDVRPLYPFRITRSVSAEFGQVLVPIDADRASTPQSDAQNVPFSHLFPGLSNLLMNEALPVEAVFTAPQIEYEFIPNPAQANPLHAQRQYPRFSIRLKCQQGSQPIFHSAVLQSGEVFHDVLFPDKAVDVRFKVVQEITLLRPLLQPKVKSFVDAICANIESGERLTAPPMLQIIVPKMSIMDSEPVHKAERTLEYIFTGVRYEHSVWSSYQGYHVQYASTRAGALGKKGGMLSMHYNAKKDLKKDIKNFVNASVGIADILTKSATNNKPMAKSIRPRDQTSARKTRRSEMASRDGAEAPSLNEHSGEDMEHFSHGSKDTDLSNSDIAANDMENIDAKENQDEGILPNHHLEDGDFEDPSITSFLSENEYVEPEMAEEMVKGEADEEKHVVNAVMEGIENEANVSVEEVVSETSVLEPEDVPHAERSVLRSSG